MKKLILIFILFLFGCSQNKYLISWEHPRNNIKYDLYVMEFDSSSTSEYIVKEFFDLENKYYIYETKKDNKLVKIGLVAKDSIDKSNKALSKYFTK